MALAWRMLMLLAAAITAITVGCTAARSPGSEATLPFDTAAVADTEPPIVGDVAVAAMDDARNFACEVEYSTIQMAIDTFTALTGAPPTGIDDLVPEYLRAPSDSFDIDARGVIVVLDGPCEDVAP